MQTLIINILLNKMYFLLDKSHTTVFLKFKRTNGHLKVLYLLYSKMHIFDGCSIEKVILNLNEHWQESQPVVPSNGAVCFSST